MTTKKQSKVDRWIQQKLLPVVGKIGRQTHLSAIRDAFALIIPLVIASAVGLIIQTIIFGAGDANESSVLGLINRWVYGSKAIYNNEGKWQFVGSLNDISVAFGSVFGAMSAAGLDILSIVFAFIYGYFLSRARKDENPVMGGLLALGTFFLMIANSAGNVSYDETTKVTSWHGASSYYGGAGLLAALIYGTIAIEIYVRLSRSDRLKLTMPDGVPEAVARAFAKLLPVVITLLAMTGIYGLVVIPTYFTDAPLLVVKDSGGSIVTDWEYPSVADGASGFWSPGDLIYAIFQSPLVSLASDEKYNFAIAIFYTFLIGFFWWFGVHGRNVVDGVFEALWLILYAKNTQDLTGRTGNIFVQGTFDAYVFLGGGEATLGLIIASLMFSKWAQERMVIRFAAAPGIFNINEPIVFGLPLVANLIYFIPVAFAMPLLTISTWILYKAFDTPNVTILTPWVTPVGIGALFSTKFNYSAFLIAVINLALSFAIWLPFILVNNRIHAADIKKARATEIDQQKSEAIIATENQTKRVRFKFKWSTFFLLVVPTFFLGGFIMAVGATFGDSTAGIAMAFIEGIIIIGLGLILFFLPFVKRFISFFRRNKLKTTN